jgi:hypothetical protein
VLGAALNTNGRSDEEVLEVWDRGRRQLASADEAEAIDGMKALCYELMDAAAGAASPVVVATFAAGANELVRHLSRMVRQVPACLPR